MDENKAKHSETFQLVIESIPSAIVLVNQEGEIAYINSNAEKSFGYDRAELVGKQVEQLVPERYREHHPGFRDSFFTFPSVRAMGAGNELFAMQKGGAEFPVEIGLNPLVMEGESLVLASIIDITERKKSEERFRLVVDSAPNAMILVNRDGEIALANAGAVSLFGYEKKELIGNDIEILVPERFKSRHPEDRHAFFTSTTMRAMGKGRDSYAVKKDGTEIQVEIGLNPIETDEGQMVLASIIDITERKHQETVIKNQVNELKMKNRELEQFAYIASHDLQEPLRTVNSFTKLLEEEYQGQLRGDADTYLNFMSQASVRMSALVKGLLDYSRIGQQKKLTPVDCHAVIHDVLADLAVRIKETHASFDIGNCPQLLGYETELRLLFQNLAVNAIKFCKADVAPKIKITSQEEDGYWKFAFQDNGIGIPKEHQQRIFMIFQRLHNRDAYEGTGIGLAHCRKIVEMHGGKIWVDSEPSKGSIFYFTLPSRGPNETKTQLHIAYR